MEEPIGECLVCGLACEPEAQMRGAFAGGLFGVCPRCHADAALGWAVRKEIAGLEAKREAGEILSDTEDDWLNSLQGLAAGLMEVEK